MQFAGNNYLFSVNNISRQYKNLYEIVRAAPEENNGASIHCQGNLAQAVGYLLGSEPSGPGFAPKDGLWARRIKSTSYVAQVIRGVPLVRNSNL